MGYRNSNIRDASKIIASITIERPLALVTLRPFFIQQMELAKMMIKPISEYSTKGKRRKDSNKDLVARFEGPCIYAISECLTGCVKVGKSVNLYGRMQQYRTSSPAEIRLEGAVFLGDVAKLSEVERETHRKLRSAGYHIRGEWFRVDFHTLRDMVAMSCEEAAAKISNLIGVMRPPEANEYSDFADRLPDFADSRHKYVRSTTLPEPR